MNKLIITSPDFEPESWIPEQNTGFGKDMSPEIHIEGIDKEAISMVITLDDLGHPIKLGYNHWIAWNIPPKEILPGNLPKGSIIEEPFHIEQGLAYGKHCYRGPKPPFNWNHRYCFTIYILDTMLTVDTNSDKTIIMNEIKNHTLQIGYLYGKYQRKHK